MTDSSETASDWADETEQRLLDAALPLVGDLGWSDRLVWAAGKAVGLTRPEAELLLPHGPSDLAALLAKRHDRRAFEALAQTDPKTLKIRERIRRGVQARLDAAMDDEAAVRRWQGFLVLHPFLGSMLLWESADVIWRWAGDTSTDENHYSKRAILSGILSTCLAIRLTSGAQAADAQLDQSIERVMQYEKFKAKFRGKDWAGELAGMFGRMRFGGF
jgi:ubiquinone biosynthesis protein COQ9